LANANMDRRAREYEGKCASTCPVEDEATCG
jgi:hypothetical protein